MIKYINTADTLKLRSILLRNGKKREQCFYEKDEKATSFHLGYYVEGVGISVVTFHEQRYENFTGLGYQLRGMATLPEYQRTGIGNQLVNFALVYLRGMYANDVWCNAHRIAYKFFSTWVSNLFQTTLKEMKLAPIGKCILRLDKLGIF